MLRKYITSIKYRNKNINSIEETILKQTNIQTCKLPKGDHN